MTTLRYPTRDIWNWRCSALVLALAAAPPAAAGWFDHSLSSWSRAITVGQVAIAVLVLAAALVMYVQYRMLGGQYFAWLCLGSVLLGAQCLTIAALRSGWPAADYLDRGTWFALVAVALVGGAVALRRRERRSFDPLAVGLVAALVMSLIHLRVARYIPALDIAGRPMLVAHTVAAVLGAVVAFRVARAQGLPDWATGRVTVAAALFAVNQAGSTQDIDSAALSLVVIATGAAGTVVLLGAALGGLRWAAQTQLHELDRALEQLAEAEEGLREHRAQMHEVTNSIAAIASASHLIYSSSDLSSPHRLRLEQMLDREAARLARLLVRQSRHSRQQEAQQQESWPIPSAPLPPPSTPPVPPARRHTSAPPMWALGGSEGAVAGSVVDLDDTLQPLVVAQEAVGHPVCWAPSGLRALGNPDDVAEAVSILLDNSRKHAPAATVQLRVRAVHEESVEIMVSDDGPGISPELGTHLFEWGERGRDSGGQGIGLHVARQLLDDAGASLELTPTTVGTTFVITLPAPARVAS